MCFFLTQLEYRQKDNTDTPSISNTAFSEFRQNTSSPGFTKFRVVGKHIYEHVFPDKTQHVLNYPENKNQPLKQTRYNFRISTNSMAFAEPGKHIYVGMLPDCAKLRSDYPGDKHICRCVSRLNTSHHRLIGKHIYVDVFSSVSQLIRTKTQIDIPHFCNICRIYTCYDKYQMWKNANFANFAINLQQIHTSSIQLSERPFKAWACTRVAAPPPLRPRSPRPPAAAPTRPPTSPDPSSMPPSRRWRA